MQMGMIGLGRMGASMVRRLMCGGHDCIVYDVNADTVAPLAHEGALGVSSLDALAAALSRVPGKTANFHIIRLGYRAAIELRRRR